VAGNTLPLDAVQMSSANSRTRSSLSRPHHGNRAAPIGPVPAARMVTLERLPAIFGLRQTGSRMSPPWVAIAQITKMSRVMRSSAQNG
jgi:hypothetical protein